MNASLILLVLGATQVDARLVIDAADALRATTSVSAATTAARMDQHAADGATDALVVAIRNVLADPALEPVEREWLVDGGLHALRRLPATPAARALAHELSTYAPRVYTRVEPEHGRTVAPLYDLGAAARFALREWARDDARTAATRSLRLGTKAALEAYVDAAATTTGDAVRDGTLDAFDAAQPALLHQQQPAVVAAMRDGHDVDRIALLMARRLGDTELFQLTIDHAAPAVALAAVQSAATVLEAAAAFGILAGAADREPVASAALLAIGGLAHTDPAVQQFLFERISDPVSGDSAAAALGRVDDPGIAARLGARMQGTKDEATRRRLVLALQLNASPAARAELASLVDSSKGSAALRKEVDAWLARPR